MNKRSANTSQADKAANGENAGRFKPYPKYKDSGIEWLGLIPEHWEVKKLKFLAEVITSNVDKKSFEGEQEVYLCNYTDVYNNEYITPNIDFMRATASREEIGRFLLKQGDVLVTKGSEDWRDIAVPAYVASMSNENILCGYHLAIIRSKQTILDGEYFFRSLAAESINYQFKIAATGITRFGLSRYWLGNSLQLQPPPEEQRIITVFLRQEISKIDELVDIGIAIEYLREYRSALITAAVTGKIDVRGQ